MITDDSRFGPGGGGTGSGVISSTGVYLGSGAGVGGSSICCSFSGVAGVAPSLAQVAFGHLDL